MKSQRNSPHIPLNHVTTSLFAILLMLAACTEPEAILPTRDQPVKNPYIQLGEYQSHDAYYGETEEPYLMYIETVPGENSVFTLSNFANFGVDITAYGTETGLSFHDQQLGFFDKVSFHIQNGSGVQTEDGIEITFHIMEDGNKAKCTTRTLLASYNGK